jgi:hypothetical protein
LTEEIQLEKRGAVMTSRHYDHETGVVPDEVLPLSGAELAAKRDPVLARAATLVGVNPDAEKAGSLFPYEWR